MKNIICISSASAIPHSTLDSVNTVLYGQYKPNHVFILIQSLEFSYTHAQIYQEAQKSQDIFLLGSIKQYVPVWMTVGVWNYISDFFLVDNQWSAKSWFVEQSSLPEDITCCYNQKEGMSAHRTDKKMSIKRIFCMHWIFWVNQFPSDNLDF